MARKCQICGKTTLFGNSRRHKTTSNISRYGAWGHRSPVSKRVWKANLRKAIILVDDHEEKISICMKCLKKSSVKSGSK